MQMIEMNDVILYVLDADDDVADQLGIGRDLDSEGVLDCPHRSDGMNGRADAAETLGPVPGVTRITGMKDLLYTAEHGGRAPGVGNNTVVHLGLDAQMSFYPGNRVNNYLG